MALTFKLGRLWPPVPFSAPDSEKHRAPTIETDTADLADYPAGTEMLHAEIFYSGAPLGSDTDVIITAKDADTDETLSAGRLLTWMKGWTEGHYSLVMGNDTKENDELHKARSVELSYTVDGRVEERKIFTVTGTQGGIPRIELTVRDQETGSLITSKPETVRYDNILGGIGAAGEISMPGKADIDGELVINVDGYEELRIGRRLGKGEIWRANITLNPTPRPANFLEALGDLLNDLFIEGKTLQQALKDRGILAAWIGNLIDDVVDFFSINIAPEGEEPVRVIFPGFAGRLAKVSKVSVIAAEEIATKLTTSSATKILAMTTKNPKGVAEAIGALSDEAVTKMFRQLATTPTGRIALARLMNVLKGKFADRAAAALGLSRALKAYLLPISLFISIVFLLKYIGFDLPSYTSNLRKEIPEASSMAVWAAVDNAKALKTREAWELAREANAMYLKFIDLTDENTKGFIALNPWLRDLYTESSDAQREQHKIYAEIIENGLKERVVVPADTVVTFGSSPEGARIYIDDVFIFEITPTTAKVQPGTHTFTFKLEGYNDMSIEKEVIAGVDLEIFPTLVRKAPIVDTGEVVIIVSPPDAEISIAGRPEITSPGTYILPHGSYTLLAARAGYFDKATGFVVKPGERVTVSITLVKQEELTPAPRVKPKLTIDSTPQGARIYIDGAFQFTLTPFTKALDPGVYVIRLELSGYLTSEESITIGTEPGYNYVKTMAKLPVGEAPAPTPSPPAAPPVTPPAAPAPPEAEISIPLQPGGARANAWKTTIRATDAETGEELAAWILINDDFIGQSTPSFVFLAPSSTYNVKLRLKGYRQGEANFTTEALPSEA